MDTKKAIDSTKKRVGSPSIKKKISVKKGSQQKKGSGSDIKSTIERDNSAPLEIIQLDGVEISLLGTAHVSPRSVQDVEDYYHKLKPAVLCVELCESRYTSMMDPESWKELDIGKVIRQKKLGLLASNLALAAFQKKIGASTGVSPGEEMRTACRLSLADGKKPLLVDREVRTTLNRAWGKISLWSRMWIFSNLLASLLVKDEIDPAEIEKMKQEDILEDLFRNLPARYESVKRVILDERDQYLAESIRTGAKELSQNGKIRGKKRILAVLGVGHLNGVTRILKSGERVDLGELDQTIPPSRWKTVLYWGIFGALAISIAWYVGNQGAEKAREAIIAWILSRSAATGIAALIARANLITVLVTVILAPVSFLLPGLKLPMVSTLTEVWLKKPRVDDFESIASDTSDLSRFWKALYNNRILHLFWILTMVTVGSYVSYMIFGWIVIHGI